MKAYSRIVAFMIVAGAIFSCACATHGWRSVTAGYARDLQLSMPSGVVLTVGHRVDIEFEIHNRGRKTLVACLGRSRQIDLVSDSRKSVDGRPPVGASVVVVDHPSCERHFALQPGGRFKWKEE